nr:hypothetical protein [Tanacetum cinerariifolium]
MGGGMAQIRPEGAPIQSSDPPLSTGGHTAKSDEGSMTLKELTDLCTTLSQKVFIHSELVPSGDTVWVGGITVETVSAARPEVSTTTPKTPPTITTLFDDKDVTIADTLVKMKSHKAKEKGVAFKEADDSARPIRSITTLQPLSTINLKDKDLDEEVRAEKERQKEASKGALAGLYDEVQAQIDDDHELAARLTHEEQEIYTVEERFTHAQLKSRSFKKIQKLYTKEQKWVDAFVPIGSEEDEKRVGSRKKRAADNDKAINYETLDIKSPIVNYESQVLGTMDAGDAHVYKLTRLDESYRHFSTFSKMLEVLDRQDVLDLHKIVMERFLTNDPEEKRYPLTKEILKKMLSCRLEAKTESTLALDLIKFIKLQIEEK